VKYMEVCDGAKEMNADFKIIGKFKNLNLV
jgi:hypothetical protein